MISSFIVTGANGDIAMSIAQIIKEVRPNAHLIGTDISGKWPALDVFDEVSVLPKANEQGYLESLLSLQKNDINTLIIPTSEAELRHLANHPDQAEQLNLLMNEPRLILTCMDKLKSIQWLQSIGVDVPETKMLSQATAADLPIMAKPRYGSGSRGLEIIRTSEHLSFSQSTRDDEPVAQELLDVENQEYTCALLTYEGGYKSFIMHRELRGGLTGRMQAIQNQTIENVLAIIAANLEVNIFINIQLRLTESGPMIFEVNPRFSSTVKMRHMLNFSDLMWAIELKENKNLTEIDPIYNCQIYRGFREIIAN